MQSYSDYKITEVKLLEIVYAGFGSPNHWTIFRKNKTKEDHTKNKIDRKRGL